MILKTSKFGDVEFDEKKIIYFPLGIYGFEEEKKFVILNFGHENFSWLQSITNSDVSLLITQPFWFMPEYETILKNNLIQFKINPERYSVFISTYLKDRKIFASIGAPFLIDNENSIGMQVVVNDLNQNLTVNVLEKLKTNILKV
ncbi:MAG: flagellar assembly protein FliW [Elusimicrobiales bacterium]|nr:flagellar assembly protein FliW [Elusimicrobiales bacterium]